MQEHEFGWWRGRGHASGRRGEDAGECMRAKASMKMMMMMMVVVVVVVVVVAVIAVLKWALSRV
jgi:hypothetical protein